MSYIRRISVLTLAAAMFFAVGCENGGKREPADHPKSEHPKQDHPKKGEHPKGEHPKGEYPK